MMGCSALPGAVAVGHLRYLASSVYQVLIYICSTLYGEKPIGVKGSKLGLSVCP